MKIRLKGITDGQDGIYETDLFPLILPNYATNSVEFFLPNDDGVLGLAAFCQYELEEDFLHVWKQIEDLLKPVEIDSIRHH